MKFSRRVLLLFMAVICFIYGRSILYPLYQYPVAGSLLGNATTLLGEGKDYMERAALVRLITQEIGDATGENNTVNNLRYVWRVIKELRKNKVFNLSRVQKVSRDKLSLQFKEEAEISDVSRAVHINRVNLNWTGVLLPFYLSETERTKDVELLVRAINNVKIDSTQLKPNITQHQPLYGTADGPSPSWHQFHNNISRKGIYDPDNPGIDLLLHDMATKRIIGVEQKSGGTQLKLLFTLEDEGQALFKPMRFPRQVGTMLNHYYFSDYERHTAEIAAFHLDRLLGLGRAPPVVGRKINMTRDVLQYAEHSLAKTFFFSPVGNLCFYGQCSYYCDSGHAFCGNPDEIEGSMAAMLPPIEIMPHKKVRHPWRRSYSKKRRADWEDDPNYCDGVRAQAPYNEGRRLLDLMDLAAFDFLMGNLDRHHYELATHWGNDTYMIHWDHGRAFGRSRNDYLSCLAPVYQCCLFRYSTLKKLLHFYSGPISLGSSLKLSLQKDPLSPVLLDDHFQALDRRTAIILQTIYKCILKTGSITAVVKDDGY